MWISINLIRRFNTQQICCKSDFSKIDKKLDILAQAVHEDYQEKTGGPVRKWEDLADHIFFAYSIISAVPPLPLAGL